MQSNVTLCMIARNEEESLLRCLKSVDGVVDEIVLVDTGSIDSTPEIGRRNGARLISHKWKNDFSEARNAGLEAASGQWILVLDADEELDADTRKRLPAVVGSSEADGVEIIVRSLMPETDVLKYEDTRIVRLFRNNRLYRYTLPIHEQIRSSIEEVGGTIVPSGMVIMHYGYMNRAVSGKENRGERNLRILNEATKQSPDNPYFHYQIGVTLMSTGKKNEAYEELKKVLGLDYGRMGSAVLDRFYMKISQLALDKDENAQAVKYASRSLDYNPDNRISMYVKAVGLLATNRIADGYQTLMKIQENPGSNLRLDIQLEHLIKACRELLKI